MVLTTGLSLEAGLFSVPDNFGAKVSLPGFDVESAADQDLYFSSSWPLLKIDDNLSQQIINLTSSNNLITHNLSYPPLTLIFSHLNGFLGPASSVNSTTITLVNNIYLNTNPGDNLQVYVCRNPLNINFQAPNIQLAQTQQGTNKQDEGIKFSKPGKDVSSTDLRDFTIHSGTKSLQVHQVIYQQLGPISSGIPGINGINGLKYNTDLPYRPVYFAFYSSDNANFVPLSAVAQVPPKVTYDSIDGGIIINDSGGTGGWGVFYVLLDPFQTTTNIQVTL